MAARPSTLARWSVGTLWNMAKNALPLPIPALQSLLDELGQPGNL
jgi:hypothetical protein